MAFTVHVYDSVAVRPTTVCGLAGPDFDPVTPPVLDMHVAVKLVIIAPLFAPAVNVTFS